MTSNNKPHAVLLPFPAQGHINPIFDFAILLHHKGFHVTFVNTEYNHNRLLRAHVPTALDGLIDFQFKTIPDGLPPSDSDATQDLPSLCVSTNVNCLDPFRKLLAKLNNTNGVPRVTCVISDAIMTFSVEAANEIGVPVVCFRTSNACSFLCNKHLPVLIREGLLPLKDLSCLSNGYLDTVVDCIPRLNNIRLREFGTSIRTTDINNPTLNFLMQQTDRSSKATAIIINTFDSLEADALAALAPSCSPVYAIGPVHLYAEQLQENSLKVMGTNLWKEDSQCLSWLDSHEPNSVIYVNFGSITLLTHEQITELAWGLSNSGKKFLWIIRSDLVEGNDSALSALPSEFISETKERGLIAGWSSQEDVLKHPSISTFLTHCGWNSVIESMSNGVPMICWPFFADQQINCRFVCSEWKVGVEIDNNVKRDEIEKLVKEMVDGDKNKKIKMNAVEWKQKAEEAVGFHGSSWLNLDKLINEVLLSRIGDGNILSGRSPAFFLHVLAKYHFLPNWTLPKILHIITYKHVNLFDV